MARGERVTFALVVGDLGEGEVAVRRVVGVEELSRPFRFEVELVPVSGEPLEHASWVGGEAVLSIRRPDGAERWVHGMCATAELVRMDAERPWYRVVLVPRLALLEEVQDSRVFQGMSAVEVVKAVIGEHDVAFRDALSGGYPKRELCVQYRETDLAFVSRLLEEEGITYSFEHECDGHTMVLADAPSSFPELASGALPFRQEAGPEADEEHVFTLARSVGAVTSKVTLRDYDFERPYQDVTQSAGSGAPEHYEHPSRNVRLSETRRLAGVRLERLRFGDETWDGAGTAIGLAPGSVFEVEGHPLHTPLALSVGQRSGPESKGVRLVAVRVEHEGRQQTSAGDAEHIESTYRNRFLAAPASRPYRPEARTRRGLVTGPQTATVVGPPGEEIHPDRYGRIKVQFHWDRKGRRDDTASAWVRLAQSWAGPAMGAVVTPRVGQEVLVRFLEGDPDRPIITGAIYNGQNPPPVALPYDRTQSTFKTESSPDGQGGNNELRFEDQAGAEQVYVHGQKDELIEVENDKTQTVRGNEELRVEKDRSRTVRGEQLLSVDGVDRSRIEGNQSLLVQGERRTTVLGSFEEIVGENQSVQVGGTRTVEIADLAVENVGAGETLTVGGGYTVNVVLGSNEAVGGAKTVQVGGASIEAVGGVRDERVGGDREASAGGDWIADVDSSAHASADEDVTEEVQGRAELEATEPAAVLSREQVIEAERFTLVVGGRKVLTIQKPGTVLLSGASVSVNGKKITLKGASIAKIGPAAAAAAQVKIAKAEELRAARAIAVFTLVDLDGQPLVHQAFELTPSDGVLRKGRTSAEGKVMMPVPEGDYEVVFPKVEGDDRTEKNPKRGERARKDAQRIERGKKVRLATDKAHVLELPERVGMTIAFLFEPDRESEWPKFVLESEDGAYREELSPKDDLVKGDRFLQLRFTGMMAGRTYRLTRWNSEAQHEIVFANASYDEIVDRDRSFEAEHVETFQFATGALRGKTRSGDE